MGLSRVGALALAVALCAGCTSTAIADREDASVSASASVAPTKKEAAFASFNAALEPLSTDGVPRSSEVRTALTQNTSFDPTDVVVTVDRTPTNLEVDTISVAYRYNGATCFVGQFISKKFVSVIAAPVNGDCLIGVVDQ